MALVVGGVSDATSHASVQVVGSADGRAFITGPNGTGIREIAMPVDDYQDAEATAVNDAGQNLGGIAGTVVAINAQGDVVGRTSTDNGQQYRAFVAVHNGKPTDLNALVVNLPKGVTLRQAFAINDARQIAALASEIHGSKYKAYIVCPTLDCR